MSVFFFLASLNHPVQGQSLINNLMLMDLNQSQEAEQE